MTEDSINILFVTTECIPFCANGGVADMSYALPKYLHRYENVNIKVVLPFYSTIPENYKSQFKIVGEKTVSLNWRNEDCYVYEYDFNNITYYFIDNKHYFERDKIIGYSDDIERFAFFCKAVLDIFPIINFYPDIIHTNDWQCGLACVLLKTIEWANPRYEHIKSIFEIHNLSYQGLCDMNLIKDLLNIDEKFLYLFDYFGGANITKATLLCADFVLTVSENYKKEIQETDKGNGLQNVLNEIDYKFKSITNGIDYEYYNPETDPMLYQKYSIQTIEARSINKQKLQEELGLEVCDKPMFCFVGHMSQIKGIDLISQVLEKYISSQIQFISVGTCSSEFEEYFRKINENYPGSAKILFGYDRHLAKRIYAGADFLFNVSSIEPCGLCPMIANRYGTLPLVFSTGGLKDNFGDIKYGGNAYILKDYTDQSLCDLIDKAIDDFSDKEKMNEYITNVMQKDFCMEKCAEKYLKIYEDVK